MTALPGSSSDESRCSDPVTPSSYQDFEDTCITAIELDFKQPFYLNQGVTYASQAFPSSHRIGVLVPANHNCRAHRLDQLKWRQLAQCRQLEPQPGANGQ
jgi:hypothetical protein